VAQVALDRAAQHAAEAGVTGIAWERHDLTRSLPQGPFDLVSAQFLQSPLDFPRIDVLRSAAGTVVPGGVLLSVSHAAAPDWSNHRDHHFPSPLEELEELALDPDTWEVLRCEVVEREGTGPDGQPGILADGVIAVRRRGI
jgi:chemotaxis protein methyltransferase CheR